MAQEQITDIMSWINRATHRLEDGPACEDYSDERLPPIAEAEKRWPNLRKSPSLEDYSDSTSFGIKPHPGPAPAIADGDNAIARAWRGSEKRGAYRVG